MKNGSNIDELVTLLRNQAKGAVKVTTCWATSKDVNWEDKTMTATGVTDDLDFFDVSLGVGSFYRKPTIGALCLIGMIENQDGAAYLIDTESVEEVAFTVSGSEYVINPEGFIIKRGNETLKKILDDLITEILKIYAPMNKPGITAIKQRLNDLLI